MSDGRATAAMNLAGVGEGAPPTPKDAAGPVSTTSTAPWQRLPYQVAVALVVVALSANAATGNRLWFTYSLVGLVIVFSVMLLDHIYRWALPERLLWWTTVPLAMHYLGGSLSGLHRIGGPNGLYYALPWWDNVVHFIGSAGVGVAAAYLLLPRIEGRRLGILLSGCVASTLGLVVELYEFVGFIWFGTVDQGFYTNTLLDLYYNALGSFAGAWLWSRGVEAGRASTRPIPLPPPQP